MAEKVQRAYNLTPMSVGVLKTDKGEEIQLNGVGIAVKDENGNMREIDSRQIWLKTQEDDSKRKNTVEWLDELVPYWTENPEAFEAFKKLLALVDTNKASAFYDEILEGLAKRGFDTNLNGISKPKRTTADSENRIQTCDKRTDPNDKVIKRFLDEIGEGQKLMVVDEKANSDERKQDIVTTIEQGLNPNEREKWDSYFNGEEKEALIASISEYHNTEGVKEKPGTLTTTTDIIYRAWVGGDTRLKPSPEARAVILGMLAKARQIPVRIDMTDYAEAYGLINGNKPVMFEGVVLPNDVVKNAIVDGRETDVVKIYRQSPYFEPARAKNQLLTYPKIYLSTGKTKPETDEVTGEIKGGYSRHNDSLWRELKPKILRRVLETKKGKLDKTMLYEWIYKTAHLESGSVDQKKRLRKKVHAYFDEMQDQGVIKKWEVVKKSAALYSIKWTFPKSK